MVKRRKYSQEFKREAVLLASQPGVTLKQIGEELGVNAGMLGRWRRELAEHDEQAFRGQGKPRDAEVAALKRELVRAKQERDFYPQGTM